MSLELTGPLPSELSLDGRTCDNATYPHESSTSFGTSSYLAYLPSPYEQDPFIRGFLRIIESILGPIEGTIDNLANYFDPRLAPAALLPWLASWVDIELDENWPLDRRRQLVAWAARLHRWRGTRRGLREYLRLYTGRTPLIVENFDGMRLDQDAQLGTTTRIGRGVPRAHCITVTVLANDPDTLNEGVLRRIIETQKPAGVGYTLEVQRADAREAELDSTRC
jgi:phage tail-like protein